MEENPYNVAFIRHVPYYSHRENTDKKKSYVCNREGKSELYYWNLSIRGQEGK